jgi:hypothetical protein
MRLLLICLFVLGLGSGLAQDKTPLTDAQVLERGRELTKLFYAVEIKPVFASFSPELQNAVGGIEQFTAYRVNGVDQFGDELEILEEEVVTVEGLKGYVRTATFVKRPKVVWNVVFVFDPATGVVVNFGIEYAGNLP